MRRRRSWMPSGAQQALPPQPPARRPRRRAPSRLRLAAALIVATALVAASGVLARAGLWPPWSRLAGSDGGSAPDGAARGAAALETPARREEPVAVIALPMVVAVNARGDTLSADPGRPALNLPVMWVTGRRAAALWGRRVLARDLAVVAEAAPDVFRLIAEARLGDDESSLLLGDSQVRIRYHPPLGPGRLQAAIVAYDDATSRFDRPPREIDLRFADQLIVRTTGGTP